MGFPGISWITHKGKSLKFYMLMYLDHHQNWLVHGHRLLIFLILALFWLSEMGQIWGFRAFMEKPIVAIAWNLHADVSWSLVELIRLWSQFVDLSYLGAILTLSNGSNLGFPGIFWSTHWGKGLKLYMLMNLNHLHNWLDFGYSLLILLILVLFWLSEMGQIWGFPPYWSCSVAFRYYGAPLTETGYIWVFWALSGERGGLNVEGGAEAYFQRWCFHPRNKCKSSCCACTDESVIWVHLVRKLFGG